MRECRTCSVEHPLDNFYTYKAAEGRRIDGECKGCKKKRSVSNAANIDRDQARAYRKEYKRKLRARQGCTPRAEVARQAKLKRRRNVWEGLWLAAGPRKSQYPGMSKAEIYRHRYNNDPEFNLKERMRRQINKAAKRDGVGDLIRGAIRRGGDSYRVVELLGYTITDLMAHLERQFTSGMDWDRFISGEIHIDHIIPQKDFDLSSDSEWQACWSLANLQPLWARDNLTKGAARKCLI